MKSPTKEIKKYAVLKEPKTVKELLKNLKYAYDHDWFLNDNFYAESTLKRVLGSNNNKLYTHYYNSDGDGVKQLIENGELQSLGFNFKYRQHRSEKEAKPIVIQMLANYQEGKGGMMSLYFTRGAVFFKEAEAVFGTKWIKKDPSETFTDGWTPAPATSEYGNLIMLYSKESITSKVFIGIFTHADGSVNRIEIGAIPTAHAQDQTDQPKLKELTVNLVKQEKHTVLKEPKTVKELLKNLKSAYDHDWFLNDDFYAESTLKRVLGSNNDELHTYYFNNQGDEVNHLIENGKLQSYGHNFKYRQHRSDKQAQLILNGIQAGYRKGKGGGLSLNLQPGVVFFEEAEAVFGTDWIKKDAREMFTNGWTPSPATSEYGNLVMEYFKESETSKGYIGILTNEDGSIDDIRLSIQEKK